MSVASPNSSGGSVRLEATFSLDQSNSFDPQNGVLVSKASSEDAAAASDSDEESTRSDDFYSIISDQVSQSLLLTLIPRAHFHAASRMQILQYVWSTLASPLSI